MMRLLRTAGAVLLLLVAAADTSAQMVVGEVVAAEDGRPIAGAFVVLLDAYGRRQAAVIANREGRYALRAAAPGAYTVQVEQIGFETVVSPVLDLQGGTTTYRFVVSPRAVQLPGITVESAARGCSRGAGGAEVQTLWEEVRKALNVAVYTQQSGSIRYTVVNIVRELDAAERRVLREERITRVISGAAPYATATDAAELVAAGFLRTLGDDIILIGPDADVLLSDAFLDGYCFRLVAGSARAEIGLSFEPIRRRNSTDVRGVLWVDAATAELRRLEYEYTDLPRQFGRHHADGAVHFRRLPDGTWIVDQWRIRMPMVNVMVRTGAVDRYGVREEGGAVLAAHAAGAALFELAGSSAVRGVLHDAVHGRPAADAVVGLSGTPFTAVTDAAGRYRIDDLPPGRYALTATTDWSEDMGIPAALDSVTLTPGSVVTQDLSTPTFRQVRDTFCDETSRGSMPIRPGIIYGMVFDTATGEPMANVHVGARAGPRQVQTRTDEEGRYRLCVLPQDTEIVLRVSPERQPVRELLIRLQSPFGRHDFW